MSEENKRREIYGLVHHGFKKNIESCVKGLAHPNFTFLNTEEWTFKPMEDIPACPDSTILFPEKDENG